MKFRLSSQGLLLVGIPLIFEIVLFSGLLVLVDRAEVTANNAIHAERIMEAFHFVGRDVLAVASSCHNAHIEDPGLQDVFRKEILQLRTDVRTLDGLVAGNPKYARGKQIFAPLLAIFDKLYDELIPIYERHDFDALQDRLSAYKRGFGLMLEQAKYAKAIRALRAMAAQDVEDEPVLQDSLSESIKTLLLIGLIAGMGISFYLARFFSYHITQRLQVIVDNNFRLLNDRALNPLVPGSDEIADLDRVFHNMTNELRAVRDKERVVQSLKEQVVAAVAQELAEPLQTVSTFLGSVEAETRAIPAPDAAEAASRNVQRMQHLVDDLVDLDRIRGRSLSINKADISMFSAAAEAHELVSGLAKQKGVSIVVTGEATAQADKRRIVQILTNLISNAVKYSSSGSTVHVDISEEDGLACTKVTDRGRGIPADMLQAIFEPFRQAQDTDAVQFGGSGLGLAICKALIESHDGTISVSSQEGAGSTFCFKIPGREYHAIGAKDRALDG